MTLRSLPMAGVREPSPRARRHAVMAAVVAAYLLAGIVVIAASGFLARPRWLALHLVVLGAASNAVLVWSRHFAQALLHARLSSERPAHVRLVVLNAAVVAVLVGVETGPPELPAAAGMVVVAVVAWHLASLVAMARHHRLPGSLRRVVGFFVASAVSLVVGAGLGAALAGRWSADDSILQQRLHLAHAHLNLFGWIGMAVLGAQVVLWPAVLRTRMVSHATKFAPVTLTTAVAGLALLVGGICAGSRTLAVAGAGIYAAAVVGAIGVMVATLPGQPSRSSSAWWLAASTMWLLVGVLVDAAQLASVTDADRALHPVVPIVVLGMVVQALVGALTFLLPVTIGGGPSGNRNMTLVLERAWVPRFAVANVGTLLVTIPAASAVHLAGWALTLTGFGSFLPLLALALTRSDVVRIWRTGHARSGSSP